MKSGSHGVNTAKGGRTPREPQMGSNFSTLQLNQFFNNTNEYQNLEQQNQQSRFS